MAFDSNQAFIRSDPDTNRLSYHKVDLDLERTSRDYQNRRLPKLTMDSAYGVAQTALNVGLNLAQLTFFNPNVIPTLIAKDVSSKLLDSETTGVFETQQQTFTFAETFGDVQTYSDLATAPVADVNYDFVNLDQHRFESSIIYGDTEVGTASLAGLNLIAAKQEALASVFAKAHERFNLYGVQGKNTYGFLNYPYYPAAINALSVTLSDGSNSAKWEDKIKDATSGANYIVNDVLALFNSIRTRTHDLVNPDNSFVLVVSSLDATHLEARNNFGNGCLELIKKTLPNLSVVVLHHLDKADSGRKIYLYPTEISNQKIGTFAFSERFTLGKQIELPKGKLQTGRAGSWGCIIRHPSAVGTMVVS